MEPNNEASQEAVKPEDKGTGEHINIRVVNADGNEVFFKIKRSTPLRKLMEAYCKRQGLVPGTVRFTFDGNRITGTETAEQLDMDDQDVIDAMVEQTGGSH